MNKEPTRCLVCNSPLINQGSFACGMAELVEWMSKLPKEMVVKPLTTLKIPGSHDSFTYFLDKALGIANDQPEWLRQMDTVLTRDVIYRWCVCQHKTVTEQLNLGVRYFDFRVSRTSSGDYRIVHGLYGEEVVSVIIEILEFLTEHTGEVLLLDFNHFYNFNPESHSTLIDMIRSLFDSKLCPVADDPTSVNLEYLGRNGHQVIVFYQPPECTPVEVPNVFWGPKKIKSPWPDTDNPKTLIERLEEYLVSRKTPDSTFFVTQGVLTPRIGDILKHCCGSLEKDLAVPTTTEVVGWIKGFEKKDLFNILICDFIELLDFTRVVVSLNYD